MNFCYLGGFAQPQQQNTSIFGAAQPAANTSSLFGQPATSAFGSAVKPGGLGGFGQTATQASGSLFGQPAAATSTSGFGSFGQTAPTTSNVFGASTTSAFGAPAGGANPGTSIAKYQPTIGTDTLMKNGTANNINTKQHCITAMKEYESKSLEELRMEDYLANRKGAQAGTSAGGGFFGAQTQPATGSTGLFGAPQTQQTTGLFGQSAATGTENKSLFGSSAFGQPATSAFGATNTANNSFMAKPFGAPATGGFGAPAADASANPFGQKPAFGAAPTTGLFGQTPATSTAPAFGQTNTGFGGFGATAGQQQQTPSLFGAPAADANKPAFGLGGTSTATTGFGGFGNTATSTAGGGIFGAKPAGAFGTTPAFGATSTANTGFSNFSMPNTGGGLFNSSLQKPATSGFGGFGTQTSTAAPLNFNSGTTGSSLFGNTAAKPGGLFGNTLGGNTTGNTTGGGLFGNTTGGFGQAGSLGGSTFGNTSLGGNNFTLGGGLGGTPQQQQPVPIHQQILSKVTSPYGDNPIFKDLKRIEESDATKATNATAQKALMENTSKTAGGSHFTVSAKSSPSVARVKPLSSTMTKKSLFEGLEEFDSSVESFSLKPNAKRLILKPNAASGSIIKTNTSNNNSKGPASGNNTPNTSFAADGSKNNENLPPTDVRNESFTGQIPTDPLPPITTGSLAPTAAYLNKDLDASRRESWLHPNNLEKVRQHNLNAGLDVGSPMNNSLSELIPRKPLETYRGTIVPPTAGTVRHSVSTIPENPFEDQSLRRESVTFSVDTQAANESSAGLGGIRSEDEQRSFGAVESRDKAEEHPAGVVLNRIG